MGATVDTAIAIRQPLEAVFGSARARVLDALLTVDDALSVRHLAELAETSASTASAALSALEAIGLVSHTEVGRSHLYRINREHALVPGLLEVLTTAQDLDGLLLERLRQALGGPPPRAVILFGSEVRGEGGPDSDLDVLVVGSDDGEIDEWRDARPQAEAALTRLIGRRVHLALAPRPTRREAQTGFWRNILREGRVLQGLELQELVP